MRLRYAVPSIKNTGEDSHAQISVLQSGSLERLTVVPLVTDKNSIGKVLVGSIKGSVQLAPDFSATDIGANTGTLKLGIAVCRERVLLDCVTSNKDWQQ